MAALATKRTHADAALIHADLLAACEAALPIVTDYMAWRLSEDDPDTADAVMAVRMTLERAIAAAKGVQP